MTIEEANKRPSTEGFFNQLFTCAKEKGISQLEVVLEEKSGLSITVNQGAVEGFVVSDETKAAIRGLYQEKMGMTYSEEISESNVDGIIKALVESAELGYATPWLAKSHENVHSEKKVFVHQGKGSDLSVQEKIDFTLNLEKHAIAVAEKVKKTDYCQYDEFEIYRQFRRDDGLCLSETQQVSMAAVSAVSEFEEEIRTGMAHETGNRIGQFSAERIGTEAGKLAADSIGAKTLKSGKYPIILINTVAAAILEGFMPVFYADRVLYQMSRLGDLLGQIVADMKVTLIDDPHMSGGGRTTYFDDEGILTKPNIVIEKGRLNTFLHNRKTAEAFSSTSTGNGFRMNHKAGVEISATNFRLENGIESLSDMEHRFGTGVLITDVQGTFAGINPLSGDFSLQSSGFWIQEGVVQHAIKGITISGNFYDLLKDIEGIANDIKFGLPYGTHVGSPSLWIRELSVAGE